MQLIRGCLMSLGLMALLFVTSCVMGISGMRRAANPTDWQRTVSEEQGKTRRMVRDYLEAATYESDLKVAGQPLDVSVQDYTDGSIHLRAVQGSAVLLEIATRFTPVEGGRETRVEVVSDGERLAAAAEGDDDDVTASGIHRAIKNDLDEAMAAIDRDQVLPRGLTVSRLLAEARGRRGRW
jgi:hypothetical protein